MICARAFLEQERSLVTGELIKPPLGMYEERDHGHLCNRSCVVSSVTIPFQIRCLLKLAAI